MAVDCDERGDNLDINYDRCQIFHFGDDATDSVAVTNSMAISVIIANTVAVTNSIAISVIIANTVALANTIAIALSFANTVAITDSDSRL